MELLLNLAWLLLALPAYWLWRRDGARAHPEHGFRSVQCLLALGCALVLLFPVISATDDLHAVRAEMEESGANKRGIRQVCADRASHGPNHIPASSAAPALTVNSTPDWDVTYVLAGSSLLLIPTPSRRNAGRAPPLSEFA
jgi:hypothetical protein